MRTVYACQRVGHPGPVPAVAYDTYADEVVCDEHAGTYAEPSAYNCEFLLHYIPDDDRILGQARPTVESAR